MCVESKKKNAFSYVVFYIESDNENYLFFFFFLI